MKFCQKKLRFHIRLNSVWNRYLFVHRDRKMRYYKNRSPQATKHLSRDSSQLHQEGIMSCRWELVDSRLQFLVGVHFFLYLENFVVWDTKLQTKKTVTTLTGREKKRINLEPLLKSFCAYIILPQSKPLQNFLSTNNFGISNLFTRFVHMSCHVLI